MPKGIPNTPRTPMTEASGPAAQPEFAPRPVSRDPEPEAAQPRSRRARRPFGEHYQKLAYDARPGFHRHWFNDSPGRIDRAHEAGYEHVKEADGKPVKRPVGTADTGQALFGYLMEIPEEWYKEDIAIIQTRVDEVDRSIRRGEFMSGKDDHRYIPKSQPISIKESR